ncbi:TPA: hypothetical protein JD264_05765 [Serratia fonticola]|nr:hypothetical protein [Serratia fonticola]
MKKTSEVGLLLISLLSNIIVSFLLGYKYKTILIQSLSEAIYYQLIIFISLTMPVIIKKIDSAQHDWRFRRNFLEFQKQAHQIDKDKLGEDERKMLDEMTNKDIHTEAKIRDLYGELSRRSEVQ